MPSLCTRSSRLSRRTSARGAIFFGQVVAGLTLGSLYALLALGYTLVYGILKLLNFAHGDVYMVGSYIGYFVLTALGGSASPVVPTLLLLLVMFGAAMVGSGLLGVTIERFAYRPLRHAPRIAPLISALGVSFFLQQTAVLALRLDPEELQHLQPSQRGALQGASRSATSRSSTSRSS